MIPSPRVTHFMTLLTHMLIIAGCCILKVTLPQATLCFISKLSNLPTHVFTILRNVNTKKATGFDNIPPKFVKYGAHILLCNPITHIINKYISANPFPDLLKCAEASPIFFKW